MKPMYREEMDALQCADPDCTCLKGDPLVIHGKCHPEAPKEVAYFQGDLAVRCAECKEMIIVVAVASYAAGRDEKTRKTPTIH